MSHFPNTVILIDELRDAWAHEPRNHRYALGIIAIVGLVARTVHLAQPFRYDEAVTYMYFARLDWADALSTYTYPNNHLFHTALAKASVSIFGLSPVTLRLPAFLAGIALPLSTYAMARALYGARTALLASGFVAASGALILYSTNARGYTMIAFAFTLLTLSAVRASRDGNRGDWLVFAGIAVLGLWTIPVMLYPLGTVAFWFLLNALVEKRHQELRSLWMALALSGVATIALYAPVVSREGLSALTRNSFVAPVGWFAFLGDLRDTWEMALSSWSLGIPPLLGVVLLLCGAFAIARHGALSRFPVGMPVAALVWCSWLLVVNHRAPFARVWLWLVPLAAALAAAGLLMLLRRSRITSVWAEGRASWLAVALTVGMTTSVVASRAVFRSTDTGTYTDAALAAERLAELLQPGDRVLATIPTNAPLMFHMHRRALDLRHLSLDVRQANRIIVIVDAREGQRLDRVTARSVVRDTTRFTAPEVVARFPSSILVMFRRRDVPAS
ncbi:MAG TPA: glycosyltransferase family 39 protein [Gemmatimonadaceae bacterium]|nr:glycosyltransferase family 39 protein [Gemmatimonadaceae bacterium]